MPARYQVLLRYLFSCDKPDANATGSESVAVDGVIAVAVGRGGRGAASSAVRQARFERALHPRSPSRRRAPCVVGERYRFGQQIARRGHVRQCVGLSLRLTAGATPQALPPWDDNPAANASFSPFCWPNPQPPDPIPPNLDRDCSHRFIAEVGRTGGAHLCSFHRDDALACVASLAPDIKTALPYKHKTAKFEGASCAPT